MRQVTLLCNIPQAVLSRGRQQPLDVSVKSLRHAAKTHLDQGEGRIHSPWLQTECLLQVPLGIPPILSCCSACCCLQA